MFRVAILAAALTATVAHGGEPEAADNVLSLTPDTFKAHVGQDKPALVMFYAPWCGHCKALKPDWAVLAETFTPKDGIVIAKVDADAHRDLGTEYGVKGFPTLKYFPAGTTTAEDYTGGRSLDDLISFVNGKIGTSKRAKKAPSAVVDLDPSNFDAVVGQPGVHAIVEFYAPWCGHCKALAPKYEKVATAYAGERSVVIAKVNADSHKDLAGRFGVTGYPTLKYFPASIDGATPAKAEDRAEDFGGREIEDFVSFLNEKAGTHRDAKGGLLPSAGRLPAFDALVQDFLATTTEAARKAVAEAAAKLAASAVAAEKSAAELYAKVLAKAAEKEGYVAKEAARVAGLLSSEAITAVKKTELMLRANVLAAFTAPPAAVESASEDAEL